MTEPRHRGQGSGLLTPEPEAAPREPGRASDEPTPSLVQGAWGRLGGTFSSLAIRDFRYLWIGSLSSQIGMWIQQVALGWLAYELTGSATFLGVVATARSVSSVALTLPAGVIADRWDRRRIILVSQIFILVVAASLAWLVASGLTEPWHLVVASFMIGATHALNMPARQSLAPQLAGNKHIANAVALNSISFNIARVLGPSVAGVLVWVSGLALCFQVQAGLMVVAVVCSIAIRDSGRGRGSRPRGSMWANLVDGLSYVWGTLPVRAVFLLASVPILVGSMYGQFMPVFARDVLDIGPSGMGAMMSAVGFGSMVGSFALAAFSDYPRKGLIMLVVCLALGQTLLNLIVPNDYRGRIMSVWSLIWSLEAIVILPAGWLTDQTGAPLTVFISGLIMIAFFVFMAFRKGQVRDYHDRYHLTSDARSH